MHDLSVKYELPARSLLLALLFLAACKPAAKQDAPAPGAVPQVAATVVTIRTTTAPGNQVSNHELIIANGRARSLAELDVWRLFDTKAGTVTTVDDIEKTIRTEQLPSLLERRRAAMGGVIPSHYPRATLSRGERKPLLGVSAQQTVITIGAYRRELWLADHPSIPEELFAMMLASDVPASPLAPIMQRVDEELIRTRGFPLADKTELPFGDQKSVIERTVVGVTSRPVPETVLKVPRDYRDLTPKPPPAKTAAP